MIRNSVLAVMVMWVILLVGWVWCIVNESWMECVVVYSAWGGVSFTGLVLWDDVRKAGMWDNLRPADAAHTNTQMLERQ